MKIKSQIIINAVAMAIIAISSLSVRAQWAQPGGLSGGRIESFCIAGPNIFAGTQDSGIFLSTNNGSSWSVIDSGITTKWVSSLALKGSNIFAGTYGGGLRSCH